MLVSHDRALLRSVCDEFWLVSRGGVTPFDGDLDDYQQFLLDEAKRGREELKNSLKGEKTVTPVVAPQPVLVNKKITPQFKALTRDLAKVEQRMAELGRRKSDLEKKLSEPLAPQEIGALGLELQAVTDALAAAEESWLALSEQIELEK